MGRWQREAGGGGRGEMANSKWADGRLRQGAGGGGDWEWRMEWRERLLGSGGTIGRGPDSGERQCLR